MKTPHFTIVSGPDKGATIPLKEGTGHLMGRHQDAAYQVKDPHVSRFHCELQFRDGQVVVLDQGGSGGVLVNAQKVSKHVLNHGDNVQIGSTVLQFHCGTDPEGETVRKVPPQAPVSGGGEDAGKLAGQTLAHFQIGELLGKGQSSAVFRAVDVDNGKPVALKVMQPAFARNEEEMQRFVRAMKTMLPIRHPNLITLHAAGKTGPYCWVSMELVEGENMKKVIERIGVAGMLDWKYAFRVAVHVGRALDHAHGQGIIHRNVTPTNILLRTEDKQVKLGDLMFAKALEGSLAQQVTKPGELVGDPNYMSPERTGGEGTQVDGRSDLFSLGATVYALLTGKPPFVGTGLVEIITNIRTAEPAKPSTFQMGIPSNFEGVVLKLLAKQPNSRFQKAADLVSELERIGKYQGMQV